MILLGLMVLPTDHTNPGRACHGLPTWYGLGDTICVCITKLVEW